MAPEGLQALHGSFTSPSRGVEGVASTAVARRASDKNDRAIIVSEDLKDVSRRILYGSEADDKS